MSGTVAALNHMKRLQVPSSPKFVGSAQPHEALAVCRHLVAMCVTKQFQAPRAKSLWASSCIFKRFVPVSRYLVLVALCSQVGLNHMKRLQEPRSPMLLGRPTLSLPPYLSPVLLGLILLLLVVAVCSYLYTIHLLLLPVLRATTARSTRATVTRSCEPATKRRFFASCP
eukprot:578858-Rhodomonas_salina.1